LPTLAIGGLLALISVLGSLPHESREVLSYQSKFLLMTVASVELPASLLTYAYLIGLSWSLGHQALARRIGLAFGLATVLLSMCLIVALSTNVQSFRWMSWQTSPAWLVAGATLGAAVVAISVYATWQIFSLASTLAFDGTRAAHRRPPRI
jgi:uncharacterized membrane protein YczE